MGRIKPGQCANCPSKEVYCRDRCTACYVFLRNHGIERPWQELEPRRQKRQKKAKCRNPNCTKIVTGHRRCRACKAYLYRNKKEKPLEECKKVRYSYRKTAKPTHCRVCQKPEVVSQGRCRNCARYWRVHQKPRPRYMWDPTCPCKTCGVPLGTVKLAKAGWCDPCYTYQHHVKRERPRELWGIGPHGWCACGRPAYHLVDGIGKCAICKDAQLTKQVA